MKTLENKINIELNEKEVKLLMSILKDAHEYRSDMTCNDPYESEESIFTKKERIEIQKMLNIDKDEDEIDGFLFNMQYVEYIIEKIKKQKNEKCK